MQDATNARALLPIIDRCAHYVVMGASGCGKSTVGRMLAGALGGDFVDADDLHPQSNIDKMSAGKPLNDDDRLPWLAIVGETLVGTAPRVMACSALKRKYRDQITQVAGADVCFIYLHGSQSLLWERISARADHFMPPELLQSQIATLETPSSDEISVTVSIDQSPTEMVAFTMDTIRRNAVK